MHDDQHATDLEPSTTLHANALFAGLPQAAVDDITASLAHVRLAPGDILFQEGDRGDCLYLLQSGVIQIYATRGSEDVTISTFTAGSYFGELALLGQEYRSASARAIDPCVLIPIDQETFGRIIEQYPVVSTNIGRRLVSQLITTTRSMVHQQRGELVLVVINRPAELRNFIAYVCEAVAALSGADIAVMAPRAALTHHTSLLAAVRANQRPDIPGRDDNSPTYFGYRAGSLLGTSTVEDAIGTLTDYFRRWFKRTIIFISEQEQEWYASTLARVDRVFIVCPPNDAQWWHPDTLDSVSTETLPPIEVVPIIAQRRERHQAVTAIERAGFHRPLIFLPQHVTLESMTAHCFERSHLTDLDRPTQKSVLRFSRALAKSRIGMALGAGGARGWAHVGSYRYLEELGIPIDAFSGTSIGALVGGGLAKGLSSHEAEAALAAWTQSGYKKLMRPALSRYSILSGRALSDAAKDVFGDLDFIDVDSPLAVVAADLVSGRGVVLRSGRIAPAVNASMSIPAMFPPVVIGPYVLVDGGVCDPVPTNVLPSMGADITIVANISFSAEDVDRWKAEAGEDAPVRSAREGKAPNLIDTYLAAFGIAVAERAATSGAMGDVYIRPKFLVTSWREFTQGPDHLKRGYAAAVAVDEQLRRKIPWL